MGCSFHQPGKVNENILECDFVPLCDVTIRRCLLADLSLLEDFAMWSLNVSWSSKITPRFLTELDGVIVDEFIWMVKSCCRVGVAEKTRSSVFARLICR